MNFIEKYSGVVALIILAIMGVSHYIAPAVFGSTSCSDTTCLTGGLRILTGTLEADGPFQIGSAGTSMTQQLVGTCSLIASSYTFTASSSAAVDCAVTGVQSGDKVFAEFATSSPSGAGWLVSQASASSTSGFITLRIVNNTGANALIPASIASTTQYLIVR